jgi:hypothetical protein
MSTSKNKERITSPTGNIIAIITVSTVQVKDTVVGEDGPGHGHEMERSLMEGEDSLNCGVGIYRGYIELRRQGAEADRSR